MWGHAVLYLKTELIGTCTIRKERISIYMGKPYLRMTVPAFPRGKKKTEVSITDERSGTRMEGNALNEKKKTLF